MASTVSGAAGSPHQIRPRPFLAGAPIRAGRRTGGPGACQESQCRVAAQVVVVDEDFEGAFAVAVVIAGAGRVEADGVLAPGCVQDLGGGDVEDFGGGVDELGDQPGAGDPVGLGAGAGGPFHDGSRRVARGGGGPVPGGCEPVPGERESSREVRPRRRAQPHSARSYPALTAPATTSGAPRASCWTSPATSGPAGRTVYRAALVTAAAAVRSGGVTT